MTDARCRFDHPSLPTCHPLFRPEPTRKPLNKSITAATIEPPDAIVRPSPGRVLNNFVLTASRKHGTTLYLFLQLIWIRPGHGATDG